jgi:lambda family phage portal protein
MAGNAFERAILAVAPGWARRRARDRAWVAAYEAATPSRARPGKRETASGNVAVYRAGKPLRELARSLEQNHDLARGVLDVLVRNTVGAGIGVEPQPRRTGTRAEIDDELAWQLSQLWRDFCKRPEVTWQHDQGATERLMARTWFRDGEVFGQRVRGQVASLDHGTRVPYSIEMLEPDFVPFDYERQVQDNRPAIRMGVEINAWGRPIAYHVYKKHPGELATVPTVADIKRVSAEQMLHLKAVDRIGQLRGVSVFASVLTRLEDIKDYEESERVAAKVAASMAAMIVKGTPDLYEPPVQQNGEPAPGRSMRFRAGMIFDDLRPGERVETIDSKRPNPNALPWRQGQLRAVAAGVGVSYSSAAKDYDGTYSSQRQELVEQWGAYQILASQFISRVTRVMYEDMVDMALAAGLIRVPAGVDVTTLRDAVYIAPQMPWIDPMKEAESWALLEDRAYASGPEIVRRRGANPHDVLDQQARWLRQKTDAGVPATGAKAAENAAQAQQTQGAAVQQQAKRVEDLRGELVALLEQGQTRAAADKSTELTAAILALAAREPAAPNVAVHLPQGLELSIPAPIVNVAAAAVPQVTVENRVEVPQAAAPQVTVENRIDVPPAPAPQVTVAAAGEAPRPWTTETTIEEFDAKGRAVRYTTKPVE